VCLHSGDPDVISFLKEHAANMPPKHSTTQRTVAAIGTGDARSGSDPGSFTLPPYREDRTTLWFRQAEGLMQFRNITDDYYRVVLVQGALSHAQQDAVAGVLEADPLPSNAYQLLKTELLRLHERSLWDRMEELLNLPTLGGQKATELWSTIQRLRPQDPDQLYRYMLFTRLPADIQLQLAEDKSPGEQLASRADELLRKAPKKAAAAHIAAAAAEENVVAAARPQPAGQKDSHAKRKFEDRKRKWSSGHGGGHAAKRRADRPQPWLDFGLCFYHFTYGSKADKCEKPCRRSEN
jgi:hypothetical protein